MSSYPQSLTQYDGTLSGKKLETSDAMIWGNQIAGNAWWEPCFMQCNSTKYLELHTTCCSTANTTVNTMQFEASTNASGDWNIRHTFTGNDPTNQCRILVIEAPSVTTDTGVYNTTASTATVNPGYSAYQTFLATYTGYLNSIICAYDNTAAATVECDLLGSVVIPGSGHPTGTRLARSYSVSAGGILFGSVRLYTFFFRHPPKIIAGTTYMIRLNVTGNVIQLAHNPASGYADGRLWNASTEMVGATMYFEVKATTPNPTLNFFINGPTNSLTDVKGSCYPHSMVLNWVPQGSNMYPNAFPTGQVTRYDTADMTNYPPNASLSSTALTINTLLNATDVTGEIQILGAVRTTGVNAAAIIQYGDYQFYRFQTGQANNLYSTIDMPHDWKIGSPVEIHIHWFTPNLNVGNIAWQIGYNYAQVNGTFDTSATSYPRTVVANNTTSLYHHFMTSLVSIDTSIVTSDGMCIILRLTRVGNHPDDTYGSEVYLVSWGSHYTKNRLGSVTLAT